MASMIVAEENSGKRIGSTTKAAMGGGAVGGGVGGALSQIIVEIFAQNDVDVSRIESAITVVLTAVLAGVGALLAGKATPTNQVRTEREIVPVGADVATGVESPLRHDWAEDVEPAAVEEPRHRAGDPVDAPRDADGYLVVDDGPAPDIIDRGE